MTGHAPFIMPDGRSLKDHLRSERDSGNVAALKQRGPTPRGKDVQWQLLQEQRAYLTGSNVEHEAAEIRMLQAVGVRRRRRWLNDKLLRDMAGPMSASDMESLFKPAPFGETGWVSPLTMAALPENAAIWDSFRNIDPEKQNRVLQKWSDYNAQQRPSSRSANKVDTPAAAALRSWARVGRNARQALRRANASTVLSLELQLLEWMEQAPPPEEQLVLPMGDPFGRLLVHGLADFHGLLSASSCLVSGTQGGGDASMTSIAVYQRKRPLVAASPQRLGRPPTGSVSLSAPQTVAQQPYGQLTSCVPTCQSSPQIQQPSLKVLQQQCQDEVTAGEPVTAGDVHSITCTDVLLALAEVGSSGNLNHHALQRYVRTHIHGASGSDTSTPKH